MNCHFTLTSKEQIFIENELEGNENILWIDKSNYKKYCRQNIYVVTDKKIMLIMTTRRFKLQTFILRDLKSLNRIDYGYEKGNLIFTTNDSDENTRIVFLGISNVKAVEDLVLNNITEFMMRSEKTSEDTIMNCHYTLTSREQNLVKAELKSEENILWIDKPNSKKYYRITFSGIFLVIIWALFFLLTPIFFIHTKNLIELIMVSLGFLGEILIFLTPLYNNKRAEKIIYIVTNKRIMIIEDGKRFDIETFILENLDCLYSICKRDGTGHLIFSKELYYDSDKQSHIKEIGFFAIYNVKTVEYLIRTIIKKNSSL